MRQPNPSRDARFLSAFLTASILAAAMTSGPVLAGPDSAGNQSGSTQEAAADETGEADEGEMHRYLVIRTFPSGALDGLDDDAKEHINATNADSDVRWVRSYANAELTKTYCVYEGPSEDAILEAAEANGIPVDEIVEIPVDLSPRKSL